MIRKSLEGTTGAGMKQNQAATEYAVMRQEANSSHDLYLRVLEKVEEADLVAGVQSSNISVVDSARRIKQQLGYEAVILDANYRGAISALDIFVRPGLAGGLGYGDLKKALFEHYWNCFAPYRARRAELAANLDYVEGVLRTGAARARTVGSGVLARARKACGF